MELYFEEIYGKLPHGLVVQIRNISLARKIDITAINEIRLCTGGASILRINGERVRLPYVTSRAEAEELVRRLCDGALYAHKSTIVDGYISCAGGVRVGICGHARYEGGCMVGVCDVSCLVIRFPNALSSLGDELYSAYRKAERGLLIYSAAGVGKTTALRTLLPMISRGGLGELVAVVDERCEISASECCAAGIAYLGGYKRAVGFDIALRTLSAQVIAVDELGGVKESEMIRASLLSGVKLVATAHATSHRDLLLRDGIRPLYQSGAFDVSFGIFYTDQGYHCCTESIV